ncbi:hypothetical protein CC1G_00023 [Coprinopsis cinerea okayama7|uniref:Uncharacterized protein n=1 Tax=Coprinopsis cinerea (strain Okayama-7 / 130 / ATCC MYA-4618 / FGSC 9003) TaxID=240176 RepID=A8NWG6_COPC7|nr:hypothetical protein CC1G_00023 [Coprinopsis cinerea okayama7\|eukprot:XP_001836887.2 hypothetical protein CC1G_00023 [Coprinopsis cinerea okayama7\
MPTHQFFRLKNKSSQQSPSSFHPKLSSKHASLLVEDESNLEADSNISAHSSEGPYELGATEGEEYDYLGDGANQLPLNKEGPAGGKQGNRSIRTIIQADKVFKAGETGNHQEKMSEFDMAVLLPMLAAQLKAKLVLANQRADAQLAQLSKEAGTSKARKPPARDPDDFYVYTDDEDVEMKVIEINDSDEESDDDDFRMPIDSAALTTSARNAHANASTAGTSTCQPNPTAEHPGPERIQPIEPVPKFNPIASAQAQRAAYYAYRPQDRRKYLHFGQSNRIVHRAPRAPRNSTLDHAKKREAVLKALVKKTKVEQVVRPTTDDLYPLNRKNGVLKTGSGNAPLDFNPNAPANSNATTKGIPIARFIERTSDLERLRARNAREGMEARRDKNYISTLELNLQWCEQHERHPDFTIARLIDSRLLQVLDDFRHVKNGPGLPHLKERVVAFCRRWREKLREVKVTV